MADPDPLKNGVTDLGTPALESLTHQQVQRRCRTEKFFLTGSVRKNALSTEIAPCPVGSLRKSLILGGKSFKYLGPGLERITPEKAVQRPVSYNWNMSIHISRLAIEAGDSMPLLLAQLYELIYSIRSLQAVEPLFRTPLGG